MHENLLHTAWADGRTTTGIWATIASTFTAEISARSGVAYVCIDNQHGLLDHSDTIPMLQAVEAGGAVPIVRVAGNEAPRIMAALDAGAMGVVVPMVNTASEARQAVEACRYPPRGKRSFGPVRARLLFGSNDPETLEDVACIVMVETAEGLENVEEIAAVEGVSAIYVGPSDLSLGLGGRPGDPETSEFTGALKRILEACLANGIVPGIQASNGAQARDFLNRGFRMVTVGSDAALFANSLKTEYEAAQGSETGEAATSNY
ncbi:MAG: aldolase/citrate lyase family protein [Dehalococcoidia bacterium]